MPVPYDLMVWQAQVEVRLTKIEEALTELLEWADEKASEPPATVETQAKEDSHE